MGRMDGRGGSRGGERRGQRDRTDVDEEPVKHQRRTEQLATILKRRPQPEWHGGLELIDHRRTDCIDDTAGDDAPSPGRAEEQIYCLSRESQQDRRGNGEVKSEGHLIPR